jgi:hypothetical protein
MNPTAVWTRGSTRRRRFASRVFWTTGSKAATGCGLLRAVKPISRSQLNGFIVDSGPSRGDPRRRAFRPTEASKAATRDVRLTSLQPAGMRKYRSSRVDSCRRMVDRLFGCDRRSSPHCRRNMVESIRGIGIVTINHFLKSPVCSHISVGAILCR